ncbi:putative regulatory protein, FmdB family [Solimonas aquatica]|uniref:Putative regulatory protein, FmdB family n=1 Tax=Solimonas aquatica TaxID=489703 RepID=A0A1H9IPK5_9GAMM|nr:zinc ribbon domain-containing protein [Solimonas aquatica]SEQ76486.1 putative regulatory protein, FmdB family [Solimonas aquatica]
MPLYDYHCPSCEQNCELLISGDAKPVCPNCGGRKLQKLLSAPAAPGRAKAIVQRARKQAAREGHFSHYSKKERSRI